VGRRLLGLGVCLLGLGCSGEPDDACSGLSERVVASASLWQAVDAEADPFYPVDGEAEVCAPVHFGAELEAGIIWFGIDTIECGYLTLSQPLQEPLCEGDTLIVRLWHFNLTEDKRAFRAALTDGSDELLMDLQIPTPAGSELVTEFVSIDHRVEEGETLFFHLSNHGTNSWGLLDIMTAPAP
jgi:hypothetical protein